MIYLLHWCWGIYIPCLYGLLAVAMVTTILLDIQHDSGSVSWNVISVCWLHYNTGYYIIYREQCVPDENVPRNLQGISAFKCTFGCNIHMVWSIMEWDYRRLHVLMCDGSRWWTKPERQLREKSKATVTPDLTTSYYNLRGVNFGVSGTTVQRCTTSQRSGGLVWPKKQKPGLIPGIVGYREINVRRRSYQYDMYTCSHLKILMKGIGQPSHTYLVRWSCNLFFVAVRRSLIHFKIS